MLCRKKVYYKLKNKSKNFKMIKNGSTGMMIGRAVLFFLSSEKDIDGSYDRTDQSSQIDDRLQFLFHD